MKHRKAASVAVVILVIIFAADTALARGRGSHSGGRHSGSGAHAGSGSAGVAHVPRGRQFTRPPVRLGAFLAVPVYAYFPPLLYLSPAVVVPYAAVDYIEKGPDRAAPESYWYYCPEGQRYYPYIEQCPGGWQLVVPGPSAP
jgi:hypothetical protein